MNVMLVAVIVALAAVLGTMWWTVRDKSSWQTTVRGIEATRIVNVDGGFREELTVKLSIVPAGATPPYLLLDDRPLEPIRPATCVPWP